MLIGKIRYAWMGHCILRTQIITIQQTGVNRRPGTITRNMEGKDLALAKDLALGLDHG